MKNISTYALILVAIIAMALGIWLGQSTDNNSEKSIKPERIQGAIYPRAKIINDFSLLNQLNEKTTKSSLLNHWSLIFVGYTQCPDICPTTLSVMAEVVQQMQNNDIQPPDIIFLSVDPERDTVDLLKPYVEYFNKAFIGLTGSLEEINELSQQLNAVFRKAPGSSGKITASDYLMDHSSALMLVNPQGNLQAILTAPHLPGTIIESIIKSQAYYELTTQAE